ncbi:MAG: response regulator, partial [Thioalkalivibrio sp.]|nr:response regulator [Thioalkalivibrio sp.]
NGIKYNRPHGAVSISCRQHGAAELALSVRDTGPGITPERQAELFQPFNRLGAENTAIQGTGVGLVITQRLVEAMSGRIEVESQPGEGSVFHVILPLAGMPGKVGDEQASADEGGGDAVDQERRVARHQVLYIEDNPANQRLMEDIFDELPEYQLRIAHSGQLGLQMAEAVVPDLVLMDIHLPDMGGVATMQALRERKATRDVPVIAVSAHAMPSDRAAGLRAGFADYLTKPIDIDRFVAVMADFLAETSL